PLTSKPQNWLVALARTPPPAKPGAATSNDTLVPLFASITGRATTWVPKPPTNSSRRVSKIVAENSVPRLVFCRHHDPTVKRAPEKGLKRKLSAPNRTLVPGESAPKGPVVPTLTNG